MGFENAAASVRPALHQHQNRSDTSKRRNPMREITPADRAARVRANIDRLFDRHLFLDRDEFFDRLEDIIAEAITEHEIDVRREYSAD
jgi:hypothetical protein